MDYGRKTKPLAVGYIGTNARTAQDFAHALDSTETRKNSMVAREIVVSLPAENTPKKNLEVLGDIGRHISKRFGVPVMVALHKPDRGGDSRNIHGHLVFGTRDAEGRKTRILDVKETAAVEVKNLREFVARRIIRDLLPERHAAWDWRSHKERGIKIPPSQHEGPRATTIRRRGGESQKLAAQFNDARRELITEGRDFAAKSNAAKVAAEEVKKLATETTTETLDRPKQSDQNKEKMEKTSVSRAVLGAAEGAVDASSAAMKMAPSPSFLEGGLTGMLEKTFEPLDGTKNGESEKPNQEAPKKETPSIAEKFKRMQKLNTNSQNGGLKL